MNDIYANTVKHSLDFQWNYQRSLPQHCPVDDGRVELNVEMR